MGKKSKLVIIGCMALFLCCAISIITVTLLASGLPSKDDLLHPEDIIENFPPKFNKNSNKSGNFEIESIYNEDINTTKAEQVSVNEISLSLDAIKLLEKKNWNGDISSPLPLTINDLDQNKLKSYILDQEGKAKKLTIPDELENTFISADNTKHINDLMKTARGEYLSYMKDQGVADKYINEIDTNTLPENGERMEYVGVNDPNAEPTSVGGFNIGDDGKRDYSQVNLILYAVDVYNISRIICNSGILKDNTDWDQCRDMAVRHLMYHEMTHVLQRAFITIHTPEANKHDKVAYVYSDATLMDVNKKYFWKWGGDGIIKDSNNRQISQESQAEGIAFEVLSNNYDMSTQQKEALWDHIFGRLTTARDNMEEIQTISEDKWPDLEVDEFGDPLSKVMRTYKNPNDVQTLVSLTNRITTFPADIGYFNPMLPEDTDEFWEFLKN